MNQTIAYFITDHGFGHAARSCCLIQNLLQQYKDLHIVIVTAVPSWFFNERIDTHYGERVSFIKEKVDVGIVEHVGNDLEILINVNETVKTMNEFWGEQNLTKKISSLCNMLESKKVTGIVFDITPLAPLVAKQLGIPSIAITNFAWCWMLETIIPLVDGLEFKQELERVLEFMVKSYNLSTHFIKLPYCAANMKGFEKVPSTDLGAWLGVKATHTKEEVFATIPSLRKGEKHMLLSFGGHAFLSVILEKLVHWNIPKHWNVVIMVPEKMTHLVQGQLPTNLITIMEEDLGPEKVTYLDLMAAMDCVVCKTGYGIVSESINNAVPVLYTDRASFREHELLARALEENIACDKVCMKDEVLTGSSSLFEKADKVVNIFKRHNQSFDGGAIASSMIFSLFRGDTPVPYSMT
jgi:UDP:flavonoid glycosyltransferase YjiC (YdhE family)